MGNDVNAASSIVLTALVPVPCRSLVFLSSTLIQVEEFWSVYSHLKRPNDLPSSINYHLFREGIAPMWEVIAQTR